VNLNKILTGVAASAVLALAAAPAQADTFQFSLTGDYTASWQLDSMPAVDEGSSGLAFLVTNVQGSFPGSATGTSSGFFFRNTSYGGGFVLLDPELAVTGAQLYTGDESSPTFTLGTFSLTNQFGAGAYTLTVTDVTAVPEPTNIALLLGGLGLFGTMAARRRSAK